MLIDLLKQSLEFMKNNASTTNKELGEALKIISDLTGECIEQQKKISKMETHLENVESYLENQPTVWKDLVEKGLIIGANFQSSHTGKKGATALHADTNVMKVEITEDYKRNKHLFRTKALAYKHYEKQYPVKYDTIRKWLTNL